MEASRQTYVTVVKPQPGWRFPDLSEVREHRDLLYYLARRDVLVRYKQAVIGVFWAVLQPLVLAGVFSLFLGVVLKLQAPDGIPYPLFAVTGMVMWLAFTSAIETASESTVTSEPLISKIYFPRILIPIASVVPSIVDFGFGLIVVLGVSLAYGLTPPIAILTVPLILLLAVTTALGAGIWLSALNVRYRDVHLVVPLLVLVGLFVTPVIYPLQELIDLVPQSIQAVYALNPMVGVLEGFRWAMLGTDWPGWLMVFPVLSSVFLLVTGVLYFERAESTFADVI
jgi:lipopolysaccharide transport system permease protein